MSCKPFDNSNNVNWLLSRWWWREAMITVSWPLKSTRSTIFSRLERLVRKNMYFCKIRQLTGVQLNCFLSASWRIQGNWYYPSFASSDQRAVNDKTVGACWQRIFSKKAASSLSLAMIFFSRGVVISGISEFWQLWYIIVNLLKKSTFIVSSFSTLIVLRYSMV